MTFGKYVKAWIMFFLLAVALGGCQSGPPKLGQGRLKSATVLHQADVSLLKRQIAVESFPLNFAQAYLVQDVLARQTWIKPPKDRYYSSSWHLRLEPEKGEAFAVRIIHRGTLLSFVTDVSGDWYVCDLSEADSNRLFEVLPLEKSNPLPAPADLPVFGGK